MALGLVWGQKGQTHSTLNTHMENVDLLISEESQQDMDLKSAFAPAVPRRAFFRLCLETPGRALEEWQTGNELTARSFSNPHWAESPQYLVYAT